LPGSVEKGFGDWEIEAFLR